MYFLQQKDLDEEAKGRITLGPLECVETSKIIQCDLMDDFFYYFYFLCDYRYTKIRGNIYNLAVIH